MSSDHREAYAKSLRPYRDVPVRRADGDGVPAVHRIRHNGRELLVRPVSAGPGGAGSVALERRARAEVGELLTELAPRAARQSNAA